MIERRGVESRGLLGGPALLCICASAVALGAGPAYANPSVGATVSAEGGYSTRARGGTSQGRGTGHAELEFRPYLTYELPRTTIRADGSVRHSQYFSGSDDNTDYTARLSVASKLSPRANLRVGASLSRANVNNILLRPDDVTVPDDPDLPPVIDPTIIANQNATRTAFRGNGGLGLVLGPRDQLNISGSAGGVRYSRQGGVGPGPGRLREYDSYQGSLGYQRAMSASLSLGAQFSVSRNDYIGSSVGDSTQYSPAATASVSLDPRWSLNANLGATFVRGTNALGRVNNSGLSGGASLCRKGDRNRLCFTGQYGYSPSSVNGVARTLSLGSNFSYQLSERTTVSARAGYSRANEVQAFGSRKFDQLSAGSSVSHQLTQRLSIFGSASYATVNDNLTQRPDNYSIGAGLRLRLGDSM